MANNTFYISRRGALAGSAALSLVAALPARAQQSSAVSAVLDASVTRPAISPFIYGGFIEHIGDLINDSLWSELLDDRKFYFPITSQVPAPPPSGGGGPRRAPMRRWTPIGPDDAVVMDASAPYVGEHSPVVTLAGARARGFAQAGLALAKGKAYAGRIVIAADSGAEVTATLVWGTRSRDRQSVRVPATGEWSTQALSFTAQADSTDGRLEITGKGAGSFRVGAVSIMPADNVHGFRADTIACMREMDCHLIRMPGGNFISAFDWRNAVGDLDKRPPIMDPVWHAVQPNDVGVDELLQMAKLINAEVEWCINTGFGEPRSGADILEYVNGSAATFWGAKRVANGHPDPWRVKYWNVGNEMYGHWQMGHMDREQYAVKSNLFVDEMRKVDPSIYVIIPGGFADEMTTGQGIQIAGQPQVEVGSPRDWAYGMIEHCWGKFDALTAHAYPAENKHYDLATGNSVDVQQSLNEWSRGMAQRIQTMADCWEAYKTHFPALNDGKVKVFFDEWAYHFQPDLKGSLAAAMAFHEFFRHTDFIDAAAFTMGTGWLSFNGTSSTINAKGLVFQLYNQHFGAIPVAVSGDSPVPPPHFPIGGDQPSVNTGSATWPLDVSAALTADRRALIVAVVNATTEARALNIDVRGFSAGGQGRAWKFTGPSIDAMNKVGQAPQVAIVESTFDASARTLAIAPISVELYEFRSA